MTQATYKSTTFLVIDDSRIDLMIIERLVKQIFPENTVTTFIESPKALEYLKNLPADTMVPHVILLDIQMPILDGFAFLDAFENLAPHVRTNTRILMMSSSTNSMDIARAKGHPSVETLLAKPVSRQVLSLALEKEQAEQ